MEVNKTALDIFCKLYDLIGDVGWTALDVSQNIDWKVTMFKDEYNKCTENDLELSCAVSDGLSSAMDLIHELAGALGITREQYIDNRAERGAEEKPVNIYVAGVGSVKMGFDELIDGMDDTENAQ